MLGRAAVTMCAGFVLSSTLFGCSHSTDQPQNLHVEPINDESGTVIRNLGPEGNSGLTLGNARYKLDSAIGDVWGHADSHYQINYTLTDGNFKVESEVVDGRSYIVLIPEQATAVFYARVFSPGDSFEYASYAFVSDTVSDMPGVGYFTDAYVGIDRNHNGTVDEAEKLSVIDGMVEFTGIAPDIQINLAVTVTSGESVTGDYSGLLDYTVR